MSWQKLEPDLDPLTLMIPNLHPPPGVIIDTQLEIVIDIEESKEGPKILVPHVITHYDFTNKTSSTDVYSFPIVPQAPQVPVCVCACVCVCVNECVKVGA